jgi:hypothetical protein
MTAQCGWSDCIIRSCQQHSPWDLKHIRVQCNILQQKYEMYKKIILCRTKIYQDICVKNQAYLIICRPLMGFHSKTILTYNTSKLRELQRFYITAGRLHAKWNSTVLFGSCTICTLLITGGVSIWHTGVMFVKYLHHTFQNFIHIFPQLLQQKTVPRRGDQWQC